MTSFGLQDAKKWKRRICYTAPPLSLLHTDPRRTWPEDSFCQPRYQKRQIKYSCPTYSKSLKQDDKWGKAVVEYATISGAGKTQWMFHAFCGFTATVGEEELIASVIYIKFNGDECSVDCCMVQTPQLHAYCLATDCCNVAQTWHFSRKRGLILRTNIYQRSNK